MFITIIRGRWLNSQHITEVNSQARDGDDKSVTDIRMSNGDIVRLYPRTSEYECFWKEWEAFLDRQAAAIETGEVMQTQIKAARPDIDEMLAKAIERILGDAANR